MQHPTPHAISRNDECNHARCLCAEALDANQDGRVTFGELLIMLPKMSSAANEDDEAFDLATDEQKARGFMDMLDTNGDGVGSREEFGPFMEKLRDMDGRLDRLPGPPGQVPTRRQEKRHKKRKKKKAETAKPDGHDEL
jgi:hypothetical protein